MFKLDLLYSHNSVFIAVTLFVLILLANEAGYWFARVVNKGPDDGIKSQTNAIQAGMLGLLALLLGFSFTMALQRFDDRSAAIIDESNAIGTAYLRAGLLPNPQATQIRQQIANYVNLRIEGGGVNMADPANRKAIMEQTQDLQDQLWKVALGAAEADPRPITSGLFIQSLNEVIDAYGLRQAALEKHIPEVVLLLLFVIFTVSGCILGYASGLGGRRPWLAMVSMATLIVLVIFIVIDLDRPRRGLIQVDQTSMNSLKLQIEKAASLSEPSDTGNCLQSSNTLYAQSPDGTRIAFDVTGDGPTIILLHGGGGSRQDWHEIGYVDATRDLFRVIAMDIRGHGESDKPIDQASYTTDKLGQDILAVADDCGASTFVLWGFSYGGNISRYLAAQSDRVAGSIIMGIPFGPGASDEARIYIENMENQWRPILRAQADNTLDWDTLSTEEQVILKEDNPTIFLAWLNALLEWTAVLPSDLHSPALWLIGSENKGAMENLSEYQGSLPKSVQVHVIEGLTHEQEFTEIDKVLPALLEFTHAVWGVPDKD